MKLLLSEVQPLVLAANGSPPLVEVTLAGQAASSDGMRRLKAILEAHRVGSPLRLHVHLPEGGQVTIAPAPSLTVAADDRLRQALETEFGAGCLIMR